jgi:hypothetical protein
MLGYTSLLTTVAVYTRVQLVGCVGVMRTCVCRGAVLVMFVVGKSVLNFVYNVRHGEQM